MIDVLFRREYLGFTGGHLKVLHYLEHFQGHNDYSPKLYLTPNSVEDGNDLWGKIAREGAICSRYEPEKASVLFVAGNDWRDVPLDINKPIINLIQHIRHADRGGELYNYLGRKALRIAVSEEVADAIRSTGKVNGTVVTINNGIEVPQNIQNISGFNQSGIVIAGLKNPGLATRLEEALKSLNIELTCLTKKIPQQKYFSILARASIVICLPGISEGFYLPALEAMALGCVVICPQVPGNAVCFSQRGIIKAEYDVDSLKQAALDVIGWSAATRLKFSELARMASSHFSLQHERDQFYDVLDDYVGGMS